jgi:exodeoxyribonuclease V alpha subunit
MNEEKAHALQLEGMEETEDSLSGSIERIVHSNSEDGWTVARFKAQGYTGQVTIVGHLAEPAVNQSLLLFGKWTRHPQYGNQFLFERYQLHRPTNPEALERYLSSGILKGVGPVTAKRMVKEFGSDILHILDNEPDKLSKISGISAAKLEKIKQNWQEQKGVQNVMLFLQGHGIPAAYALRIYRHYGDRAIEVVEKNPYQLAADVSGIGFRIADRIARKMGFASNSPFRIEAGLIYALEEAGGQHGHVFLPRRQLISAAQAVLSDRNEDYPFEDDIQTTSANTAIDEALERLLETGKLIGELLPEETDAGIYLPEMYDAERGVAAHLRRLIESPAETKVSVETVKEWRASSRQVRGITLSEEQAEAVVAALTHKVMIITGGPGVGKTTATKAVVDLFEDAGCKIELACPTGRAAKRLSELTGRPARTIHRLLELDPITWQFRRNRKNPLEADVIVVDESSMLDLNLAHCLLDAIPDAARLILVGDADQLPSVGPGIVLRDLLGCHNIARVKMLEIFRQAKESLIVTNAHRVNEGQLPVAVRPGERPGANCLFISHNEPERITESVVSLVGTELAKQGFAPGDIQVITPMHKGDLGTVKFNQLLQSALNPATGARSEIRRGEKILREGDRVMQIKNNYSKQVFNGDVGTIVSIDEATQEVAVQFVDQSARYEADELDELELAYAMSVHKSQGSEYPAVIIIVHPSHYVMLQRNLLYTALTRAQRLAILIGNNRAVWRAVHNNLTVRRHSRLKWRVENG